MKDKKNPSLTPQLTPYSQKRLLSYTTAAGLGAFFAGHGAEAQVTESAAFAPYPATILPPPNGGGTPTTGTNGFYGFYHYFSIDGSPTPEFYLAIGNPVPNSPTNLFGNQFIDLFGQNGLGQALTPTLPPDVNGHTNNAYLVPFLGGTTISAATGSPPFYQPRLAISYLVKNPYGGYYNYLDSKYISTGALGFQFVGHADGQTHFGYMDVQVNTTKNTGGYIIVKSVVIKDVYYNATPNAGITVPINVAITGITVGAGNAVTINFTSNDNAPASDFTLQTSPTLGASASWTNDPAASISLITSANLSAGIDQAVYQAVTTGTGGASQYYRLSNSN